MEDSHRQLLRTNRMDLALDLDVDSAVTYLYADSILSENDRDSILAERTRQDKSNKLLDVLPKRGPEAFGSFARFLDKYQPFLGKFLKPATTPQASGQALDNYDSSGRPFPERKPAEESSDELNPQKTTDLTMKTGVAKTQEDGFGSKEPNEKGNPDEGDGGRNSRLKLSRTTYKDGFSRGFMYPMDRRPRGHAFIINNKTFMKSSGMEKYPRNGTDVDAKELDKLFRALEFESNVYHNKTKLEIISIFDYYAAMDHSRYNCIICAILTHGEEGLIYSIDAQIQIKELTAKFRSKNLRGIPKLFFFQACQGFEYMEGVEPDSTDGPVQEEAVDEVDAPGNNKITLPIEADFMYAYSTVPGYYSWRNSARGSWFVQAIVSVFKEHAMSMDLLRMMTRVNSLVAEQSSNTNEYFSDNKKQIPSIISQLRKELYFFPEYVLDESDGDITDANLQKKYGKKNCYLL